jgi:hypothetical protein
MPLSTNSIIHYTKYLDNLLGIIKEGFGIKYCAERLKAESSTASAAAHPMISFCDIPLSQTLSHVNAYGHYAIGLSKDWAVKMHVNPVLYLEINSSVTQTLSSLLKDRRKKTGNNLTEKQKTDILRIKCFTKNYSGQLKRKGKTINDYKFYDEREWRLVPSKEQLGKAAFSVDYAKYKNKKDDYNEKIKDLRFNFSHQDISYIIVATTEEIPKVIAGLRERFGKSLKGDELDLLISKICSIGQIQSDY